jgi:hypothetical protein
MQARSQTAPPLAGDLSARTAYADTERPARVPPTLLDDWMPVFLAQITTPDAQFVRVTDNEGAQLRYLSEGLTGLARRRPRHPRGPRTRHRSTPWPKPASGAGPTRVTEVPAARSAPRAGDGGRPCPPVSRR